jgi:UDP:flavonoid glycosyltransferase YjiC (YdhE family)
MSTRIILATFGSFGDLHPTIAIAHELRRRGHRAVIATSAIYRTKIEADGLGFHAVRPDLPPPHESGELTRRVMDPLRGPEYLFRRLLIPALRDSYNDLAEAARGADLLVSYPTTLAAPLVAEKLGRKWVSVNPWPMSIWSAHDFSYPAMAPLMPSLHRLSPSVVRALGCALLPLLDHWMKDVRALRRELGLPSAANPMLEGQYSPYAVLALFSPLFAAPQFDWPPQSVVCGYCFYDRCGASPGREAEYSDEELAPELRRFLENGEPPIVFTLGSAAVYAARDFYAQSIIAAQSLGQRALLLIGDEQNRPTSLPQNTDQIAAFSYAPYSQVFGAARAIVHHGGGGTIGQILRAGKPSLTVPFGLDQPDHAMRLYRMGVARYIPRRQYSAPRAVKEIEALLKNEEYAHRAQTIATQVQREDGPRTAADAIERVLRS